MHDVHTWPELPVEEAVAAGPGGPAEPNAPGWAALLEWCYQRVGRTLPLLEQLAHDRVPQPYRKLLVHSSDMTPTLEGFFGGPLQLRVVERDRRQDSYCREVVLLAAEGVRPVLYGAVRIFLSRLPAKARESVQAERHPLGHILRAESIPHLSWPQAFFRVGADAYMAARLRLRRPQELFGRRNVLLDGSRRMLAEVMEVLAPVDESPHLPGRPGNR